MAKPIERISFVQSNNLTLMAIADFALYGASLAAIARHRRHRCIKFLGKGGAAELPAEARLMNIGKRLAAGRQTSGRPLVRKWSSPRHPDIPFRCSKMARGIILP